MAQMIVTSLHMADAERTALQRLADEAGVNRSRCLRLAASRLVALVESGQMSPAELREEAEALPDGRRSKRDAANSDAATSEGEVPVGG